MYKLILGLFLLFCFLAEQKTNGQHAMVWEIPGKPTIAKIFENFDELFPNQIVETGEGAEIVKNIDLEIKSYMRPKLGYYKFEGRLLERQRHVAGFYKSVEFWEKPNSIVVRTYIDIVPSCHNRFPFRWINRKRANILWAAEPMILQEEHNIINRLLRSG